MKNLMDSYLSFSEKRIKKYMRIAYSQHYNDEIVSEFLKTYINARYYNIRNTDKPARAFYLRIMDELDFKEKILIKKNEETEDRDEKQKNLKMINNVKEVFSYILFFDNVRKVENFKKINSIKEIVKKIIMTTSTEFGIKASKDNEEKLYKEVSKDMVDKELFLEKFETDEFTLNFEICEQMENVFFAKLEHSIKMPNQYSDYAVEKVFTEGIIAEDKLQVEYILLSLISVRDILDADFKDIYIAEFANTLFKKKTKLDSILSLIENQALQEKIYIDIDYSDYIKNNKAVLGYIADGFNFVITLDSTTKSVEDVEKLKMFKMVIAPSRLALYKELKQNKELFNNVIFR